MNMQSSVSLVCILIGRADEHNDHAEFLAGVGDVEWLYKSVFETDNASADRFAKFIFEGLDTICDIYLVSCTVHHAGHDNTLTEYYQNEEKILSTDNMFRTYIHQFSKVPPAGSNHTLLLHFKSAKALAKAVEGKYGKMRAGSTNLGDPSRVYVRKAQYDWRWVYHPFIPSHFFLINLSDGTG